MTFVTQEMCLRCPANKILSLNNSLLMVPTSIGELYDKISILEIKQSKIEDKEKITHIDNELTKLKQLSIKYPIDESLYFKLKNINNILWDVEDEIREKERDKKFDERFIELARMVYKTNDWRSDIKKEINLKYNSDIVEVKSYESY